MRISILTTRNSRYHPNARLLHAAESLGYSADLCHPKRVIMATGFASAGDSVKGVLADVVMPRIGSTIEDSELCALYHLEQLGIPAVNGFFSLIIARDKFLSLRRLQSVGLPVPPTVYVTQPSQIEGAVEAVGGLPVVIKSLRGRQGVNVHLVDDMEFARYMASHPPRAGEGVLVQRFIPTAMEGDFRLVVVGDQVVASMKRIPRGGEFRANVHLRAKGVPWIPSDNWSELALKAAKSLGLDIAGIDMLQTPDGPVILEVNTTPGFRELERVTGIDVAKEMVIHAARKAAKR